MAEERTSLVAQLWLMLMFLYTVYHCSWEYCSASLLQQNFKTRSTHLDLCDSWFLWDSKGFQEKHNAKVKMTQCLTNVDLKSCIWRTAVQFEAEPNCKCAMQPHVPQDDPEEDPETMSHCTKTTKTEIKPMWNKNLSLKSSNLMLFKYKLGFLKEKLEKKECIHCNNNNNKKKIKP